MKCIGEYLYILIMLITDGDMTCWTVGLKIVVMQMSAYVGKDLGLLTALTFSFTFK